ncbi:MAG: glycosyltransferase family 4 protein [Micrococcales bacterium]|nr:glycosyltransferase family 4 protein [Micrococcales bacterium]
MARLRILELMGTSDGGVRCHVAQVVELLAASNQVLTVGPASSLPVHLASPTFALPIGPKPSAGDLVALAKLRRLAAKADVIHAHGLRVAGLAVLATRGLRPRPRVVATWHNRPIGGLPVRLMAAVLSRLAARADATLVVSPDLKLWADRLGAKNVELALVPAPLLPPGADRAAVRAHFGIGPDQALLVTVSRLAQQKGLDLLVNTASRLPEGVVWLVAGQGPQAQRIAGLAQQRQVDVRLIGHQGDVAGLFHAADIVVSTALWEGQSIALQEALAAGAAIVATDVGGTRFTAAGAAWLSQPNPDSIAAGIGYLLNDPAERLQLQAKARQRAADLPSTTDLLNQLNRVLLSARS